MKQVLVTKKGLLVDCMNELSGEAESIQLHLFSATWQYEQYSRRCKRLQKATIWFGENGSGLCYTCKYQNEVQSAH